MEDVTTEMLNESVMSGIKQMGEIKIVELKKSDFPLYIKFDNKKYVLVLTKNEKLVLNKGN